MVLKECFLTILTVGGCGGLERTEGVVVFNSF